MAASEPLCSMELRLAQLRTEYERGVIARAELDATLLRIGGAIQVLEELLGDEAAAAAS
jgi:hypothetical protein